MESINFEDIRPYNDDEVHFMLQKVIHSDYFSNAIKFAFPDRNISDIAQQLSEVQTIKEFQINFMCAFMLRKIQETSSSLSFSGFDKIQPLRPNLFISNHRDIVLDSAILQILLHQHHFETSEIAIGSNLMKYPLIDIVRLNKMFKIERSGKSRELLHTLQRTSHYMRYVMTQKKNSIWIAQRNGRSKDGNDRTDTAVLKMLSTGSDACFAENLNEMHITPIVISYEFESCDFMRTRELYITKRQEYVKMPNEDFDSIYRGCQQWKGNIHLSICDSITLEELQACDRFPERNEKFRQLAHIIDQRIHKNYHLWKTNYIAYDLLNKTNDYQSFYTKEERENFLDYAKKGLQPIDGDSAELMEIFLGIYANPVTNSLL